MSRLFTTANLLAASLTLGLLSAAKPVIGQETQTPNVCVAPAPAAPAIKPDMVWQQQAIVPEPTSEIAEQAIGMLDESYDFNLSVTLAQLPNDLSEITGIPVMLDDRAVVFAELNDSVAIEFAQTQVPLRTALRQMLSPLGLKVVVEDEGFVITADPVMLVRKGIATSRWLNVDEEVAKAISFALAKKAEVQFIETPLEEAILSLSRQYELPILIDRRALEEFGLTPDLPVSLAINDVKLESVLKLLLKDHNLTLNLQSDTLTITTTEACKERQMNRIYWLEGTGVAAGNVASIVGVIQTTLNPEGWEQLGGTSTITTMTTSRPALVVSTNFEIHRQIEAFLSALRESSFGREPVLQSVEIPARTIPISYGGGMMGGGMGGMGGGMGGMGGGMF